MKLIQIFENQEMEFGEKFVGTPQEPRTNKVGVFPFEVEALQHHHRLHTIKLLEGIVEDMEGRKGSGCSEGLCGHTDDPINQKEHGRYIGKDQALTDLLVPVKELLDVLYKKI